MGAKGTVDALLQRLTQLEQRTAAAEQRAEALEARLGSANKTTIESQPGGSNGGNGGQVTRGRFMKAAGMGLAGLAGAAILEKATTKDAYATTYPDTVFAQGFQAYGGSATGFGLNAPSSAALVRGATLIGANYGVLADSNAGGVGVFAGNGGRASLQLQARPGLNANPSLGEEGDILLDGRDVIWTNANFTVGWAALHYGGLGQTLFTGVSTQQYLLENSDGVTWVDMDTTKLQLNLLAPFDCQAIITVNADLWTTVPGHNQDIAATITGGAFGTNKVVAWKESNGANSGSPNAAYLETVQTLTWGINYSVKVQWKANNASPGVTIVAGAGPIPSGSATFSPTRINVRLVPDKAGSNAPASGPTKQLVSSATRR